jgi:hypothetical protein|tara:strand:+ start:703 stop:849 length:147 start_codon:yes stop_codon:yes gene_type:complete
MSKIHKRILKLKKILDKKALREPRSRKQKIDRINWERVRTILHKRYER